MARDELRILLVLDQFIYEFVGHVKDVTYLPLISSLTG